MIKIEEGKKYLITGGAGFLGGELIERILKQGGEVVTVSRNEGKLIELKSKYKDSKLEIHTGDICDEFTLPRLMRGITGVFHLAAFKHVGLAETQGRECIKSNVIGSMNVFEQSRMMWSSLLVYQQIKQPKLVELMVQVNILWKECLHNLNKTFQTLSSE